VDRIVTAMATWSNAHIKPDERGANLVEYAMLVGFIAVVCLSAVAFFGSGVVTLLTTVRDALPS
jgi:Flp pilus assembly pilin Flp